MLNRNNSMFIDGIEWKVFECAVCDDCGRIAVVGCEMNGHLEFATNSYDPNIEYFLLRDCHDTDFDSEENEEDSTTQIEKK